MAVYRLLGGGYLLHKVGRSRVAHRETCPRVTWQMPSWLDAGAAGEAQVHRWPCPECRPVVGDGMDPQTRLEATRTRALVTPDAATLVDTLVEGRRSPPELVQTLLGQAAVVDDDLAKVLSGD
jgi:hypothetical protein